MRATSAVFVLVVLALLLVPLGLSLWLDARWFGAQGLSAIFALRLQTQENLTSQIAVSIDKILKPRGVAVMIEAEHICMSIRGVERLGSKTITTHFEGAFRENASDQARFMMLLGGSQR